MFKEGPSLVEYMPQHLPGSRAGYGKVQVALVAKEAGKTSWQLRFEAYCRKSTHDQYSMDFGKLDPDEQW